MSYSGFIVTPRDRNVMASLPREIDTDSNVTVAINSKELVLASDKSGFVSVPNDSILMARKLKGAKLLVKYRGAKLDDGSYTTDVITFPMTNEQEVDEVVAKITRALIELRVCKTGVKV